VQCVERVKKLFLGSFFAFQELDVINHQNVQVAVATLERFLPVIANGVDVVVGEFLTGHILHTQAWLQHLRIVASRVQKVRFPQARAPRDEQGVEGGAGRLGHGERGGVGEAVRGADDEGLEGVLGIEVGEPPVLKTWEGDGGAFITMGQVYTKDLNSQTQNLGMYRLQIYGRDRLGMHWQIHKDGAGFFDEYRKAGRKMPVSVAIGGDPLYIWCGQAPLPKGVFELLLYGFIRKEPAKLVKSLTNEIYVPHDADYVIEGFVDTDKFELEGPFGDHTGFYTPVEPFPVMEVTAITSKREPLFHATVVGKPPLEDKYMGWATERIFLPLLRTTVPELLDYNMPENGVFHNLILAKINALYPAHAKQAMHAFWGVGQMSFVKHAVFVGEDAPDLSDYDALTEHILNRFGKNALLISEGVCDQLDHASPNSCFGGKLGIDATQDFSAPAPVLLDDAALLAKFKEIEPNLTQLVQFKTNTKTPICVVKFDKNRLVKEVFEELLKFKEHFKLLVFVGPENRLENPYMLLWRVTNNIDALRDIYVREGVVCIDATAKGEAEGYTRGWPLQTDCDRDVVADLVRRGIVKEESELFSKFEIFG